MCVHASSLEATGCRNNRAVALESDTVVSQDGKKHPEEMRSLLRRPSCLLFLKYEGGWRFGGIRAAAAAILLTVCI